MFNPIYKHLIKVEKPPIRKVEKKKEDDAVGIIFFVIGFNGLIIYLLLK